MEQSMLLQPRTDSGGSKRPPQPSLRVDQAAAALPRLGERGEAARVDAVVPGRRVVARGVGGGGGCGTAPLPALLGAPCRPRGTEGCEARVAEGRTGAGWRVGHADAAREARKRRATPRPARGAQRRGESPRFVGARPAPPPLLLPWIWAAAARMAAVGRGWREREQRPRIVSAGRKVGREGVVEAKQAHPARLSPRRAGDPCGQGRREPPQEPRSVPGQHRPLEHPCARGGRGGTGAGGSGVGGSGGDVVGRRRRLHAERRLHTKWAAMGRGGGGTPAGSNQSKQAVTTRATLVELQREHRQEQVTRPPTSAALDMFASILRLLSGPHLEKRSPPIAHES